MMILKYLIPTQLLYPKENSSMSFILISFRIIPLPIYSYEVPDPNVASYQKYYECKNQA